MKRLFSLRGLVVLALAGLAIYWFVSDPVGAGQTVKNLGGLLKTIADGIVNFLGELSNG